VNSRVCSSDLQALQRKYVRMLDLRNLHLRGREDATFVEPDPRPAMSELAREFPGSLRELDRLPLERIRARLIALECAVADEVRIEPWMRAQTQFHRHTRGVIAAKRWLSGRRHITAPVQKQFIAEIARFPHGVDALPFVHDLARIADPPGGRLMNLVFARLAESLGASESEARTLVFGDAEVG